MSYKFKCYTDGNQECFVWEADTRYYTTKKAIKKEFEFTQSLLDFLDLDIDDLFEIFKSMGDEIQKLYQQKEGDTTSLRKNLDLLAEKHIYFQFLRLYWFEKLNKYVTGEYEGKVYDFMPYKTLTHIPMKIRTAQHQIRFMIDKALDVTADQDKTIQQRIASLYIKNSRSIDKAFEFHPITLNFECVDDSTMAEVLSPNSIIDIVDYLIREIIRREINFKVCKSCGKYFPATAHGNTEFCNRLFQDTGKTCRDIGSLAK